MFSVDVETTIGQVAVQTTQNKGLSPEYWTERILERLVSVSDNADPMVKAQAEAFKDKVRNLVQYYVELARREERATICAKISEAGQHQLADAIGRL